MEKEKKSRTSSSAKKAEIKKKLPMIAMIAVGVVLLAVIITVCTVFSRRGGGDGTETTADTASLAESTASDSPGQTRLGEYVSPQDFDELKKEYPDTVAYIEIPDTTVSYPVVKHPTYDEFYLIHYFDGTYNPAGSIYIESYNKSDFTDPVTVIYGHNMNGNTNSKTPYFSFFQKSYCDSEYMKSHDKIKIYLPDREIEYRIAAAVEFDDRHLMYETDYTNKATLDALISEIYASNSSYNCFADGERIKGDKPILILSTCYMWDDSARYLIVAEQTDVKTAEKLAQ